MSQAQKMPILENILVPTIAKEESEAIRSPHDREVLLRNALESRIDTLQYVLIPSAALFQAGALSEGKPWYHAVYNYGAALACEGTKFYWLIKFGQKVIEHI